MAPRESNFYGGGSGAGSLQEDLAAVKLGVPFVKLYTYPVVPGAFAA